MVPGRCDIKKQGGGRVSKGSETFTCTLFKAYTNIPGRLVPTNLLRSRSFPRATALQITHLTAGNLKCRLTNAWVRCLYTAFFIFRSERALARTSHHCTSLLSAVSLRGQGSQALVHVLPCVTRASGPTVAHPVRGCAPHTVTTCTP